MIGTGREDIEESYLGTHTLASPPARRWCWKR